MPYHWDIDLTEAPSLDTPSHTEGAAPIARLTAWPYRSLPKRGFAAVIGIAFAFLLVPLLAVVGLAALWVLLVFALLTLWALWALIQRNYRDGEILEELTIWPDLIRLTRDGPRGAHQVWEANPYWVTAQIRPGPVAQYLTLKGEGREVELGAFLHESERPALLADLERTLARTRSRQ